jgi:hypothetical protein
MLGGLALLSCRRTEAPVPERWGPPTTSAEPRPETPSPSHRGPFTLGQPCDPARRQPPGPPVLLPAPATAQPAVGLPGAPPSPAPVVSDPDEQCGRRDLVSVVIVSTPYMPSPPGSAVKRRGMGYESMVYLDGSRVWIDALCIICRVATHKLWVGEIALMTEEQLATFQTMSGLPAKPLLGDPGAWKKALGA